MLSLETEEKKKRETYLWALCWNSLSMTVWEDEEAFGCVATPKVLLPL